MKRILVLALCALSARASELVIKNSFASHKLGDLSLIRTDEGYEVLKDTNRTKVKSHDVDALLKNLDKEKLEIFIKDGHGYPEIKQLSNGDYKLRAHVRGEGSGPITGMILAWTVRAAMYIPPATAASVAVATTGPVGVTAVTLAAGPTAAYLATVEGASTAAAIIGYSCWFLP